MQPIIFKEENFINGRVFGYARVSSQNQYEDWQLLAMKDFPIRAELLYVDKQSGKDFDRPAYRRMAHKLRKGDLLIVKSIDRLGRNYQEIIEQWRILTMKKGVDIVVLDIPLLDTRQNKDLIGTLISDLVLQLLSFVAQSEHENIRQRQQEGISAAKQRGVKFGRPSKITPDPSTADIFSRWQDDLITVEQASRALGVSIRTAYRWRK